VVYYMLHSLSDEDVQEGFEKFSCKFANTLCVAVSDYSSKNPWMAVEMDASLKAAIFFITSNKLHRIPIINGSGELITVLSQSRIVNYLTNYIDLFGFNVQTVEELQLGYKDVITIREDVLVKDAFTIMRSKEVSGLGVVNVEGHLVGTLSVSDLRDVCYPSSMIVRVELPVSDFLKLVHEKHPTRPSVIGVTPDFTVAQIAERFRQYRVHRIFVVHSAMDLRPIGVISLYDFLLLFRGQIL